MVMIQCQNSSFWVAQKIQRGKGSGRYHRSGRSSTSRTEKNIQRVRKKVQGDRHFTVRIIADELQNGTKVAEWRTKVFKCVETFWSNSKLRSTWWNELLLAMSHGIFKYDPLTKRQSLEWKSTLSPRPKKARMFKYKTKVMLIAFFDVYCPWNCLHKIFATRPNY